MGGKFQATCEECGFEFYFRDGGGFFFYELRCDRCRRLKTVTHDELGDLHQRHLEEVQGLARAGRTVGDQTNADGSSPGPLTSEAYLEARKAYFDAVEEFAGVHEDCGGQFRFGLIPRCPKCKSDKIEVDEPIVLYD